ncbi:hypothetical protein Peur_045332 [Populus x canadensis]
MRSCDVSGTRIIYCIPEVAEYEEYPDVVYAQISSLDDEDPCFIGKVEGNRRTKVKYFNDDVAISNKVIVEFDIDELDLLNDDDDGKVGRNFDDGSLGSERTKRGNVGTSSVHDKGGDKYADDDDDDDDEEEEEEEEEKEEENDDYIPFDGEGFEFVNEEKDEWIASLDGDVCFGKSLLSGPKLEDEWKISSDEDVDNITFSVKSYSSFEG